MSFFSWPRKWIYGGLVLALSGGAGVSSAALGYWEAVEKAALEPREVVLKEEEPAAPVEVTPEPVAEPVVAATPKAAPTKSPAVTATPAAPAATETTATPSTTTTTTTTVDDSPPLIKHLGVSFGRYDAGTGRAGAFKFINDLTKPFLDFGEVVTGPDGTKALPTFEYYVDESAAVYAIADGYVLNVTYQDSTSDYEIEAGLDAAGSRQWRIYYDHVRNLSVSVGSQLSAGQQIGTAGTSNWSGIGRTEIMINHTVSPMYSYCPFAYYDSSVTATHQQQIRDLIADWESYKGDTGSYDEGLYTTYAGCRSTSMLSY